jgi:hypothetical protein
MQVVSSKSWFINPTFSPIRSNGILEPHGEFNLAAILSSSKVANIHGQDTPTMVLKGTDLSCTRGEVMIEDLSNINLENA